MNKYALALCVALPLAGCNSATTATNNVLANLAGGTETAVAFQVGCSIVQVAEGYFANVKSQVSPAEALAVSSAEAVVTALCKTPPTNLSIAFNDLLSAWNVIQAGTTVPTSANPTPSIPALVVNSIPVPTPTPSPTASP